MEAIDLSIDIEEVKKDQIEFYKEVIYNVFIKQEYDKYKTDLVAKALLVLSNMEV